MEEKILKLLTLEDDKEGIEKIALEVIKDNSIRFYTDYRDFENIESFVDDCKDQCEFEDKIIEGYDEWLYDTLRANVSVIIDELHKHYEFDEVSDSLFEYLQLLVNDNTEVEYPISDFLRQELKVNLLITFSNSTDAETEDLDYTTLAKFLLKLGYVQPKTIIKEMIKGEYKDGEDKFLNSLHTEIMNAYKEQYNYLTVIGTLSVKEYFQLKDDPRKVNICIDNKHYIGFFDPYNGGGSTFAINLQKPLTLRGDTIHKVFIEGGKKKYTVDDVYGFTSSCFQPIGFVKGMPKSMGVK